MRARRRAILNSFVGFYRYLILVGGLFSVGGFGLTDGFVIGYDSYLNCDDREFYLI